MVSPRKVLRWKPELPGKIFRLLILNHATDGCWDAVQVAVIGTDHPNLQLAAVNKGVLVLGLWQENFPVPAAISSEGVGSSVPTVEIPNQVQGFGMGSPFPVGPAFANRVDLYAVVFVATCKFYETARIVGNGTVCRLEASMAPLDYLLIGL